VQIDTIINRDEIRCGWAVKIDGVDYSAMFGAGWTTTHDADAAFASASLPVERPFGLSAGRHTVAIYAGWGTRPTDWTPCFVGEITNEAASFYPSKATLTAGGYLRRTDVGLDVAKAFCNVTMDPAFLPDSAAYDIVMVDTDAAIIVHILETYGITPATTGHFIEASDWQPALLDAIIWESGSSGWAIIQEIDRVTDYRTSDGRLGQVLRKQVFGTVPSGVRHTFHQGIDILDLQVAVAYEVYNQVKVTGHADPSLAESDPEHAIVIGVAPAGEPEPSSYIPTPPGVRTDTSISSDYIETEDDAIVIAQRVLGRLSQPLQDISVTTFGCADLDLGDGIGVVAAVLDLDTWAFVVGHTIGGAPFQSNLRVRGSTDAAFRGDQPPTPQMLISVILEHVLIDGALAGLAMITVDASASSDSDGTIVSWTISIEAATFTGTDIATAVISYATLSASPVDVTLTVTDDGGLSATLTQQAVWDPATALVEPLVAAEAVDGAASDDGEVTWKTFAASVTAVAPIALGGTVLFGCSDGKVYRSEDMLATAPTLVHTFPSGVTSLWNNEITTDRWLAGLESGALHLSIDDGVTWPTAALHTFAEAVNDCAESPYAAGEISVCSGHSLHHCYDNGASWTALLTGAGTALRLAAAHFVGVDRSFCGFDDGTITSTTGDSITLDPVAEVRGLTIALDATELFILTDSVATYSWTPDGGLVAGPPTGTATNRAIRSGAGTWIYCATDGALQKLIPHTSAYDVRLMSSPQRALAVGYGSVHAPLPPPPLPAGPLEVYVPTTSAASPGGVYHYVPGAGWELLNSGLPAAMNWRFIAASPLNPDHLIMLGQSEFPPLGHVHGYLNESDRLTIGGGVSCLWGSTDGGQTWFSVPAQAVDTSTGALQVYQVEFSRTTPQQWYMTGTTSIAGTDRTTRWGGTLTTPAEPWHDEDYGLDVERNASGDDEDTLMAYHGGTVSGRGVLIVQTPPHAHPNGIESVVNERVDPRPLDPDKPNLDLFPGTRKLFACEGPRSDVHRIWYCADYRSEPIMIVDAAGTDGYVACCADGSAYISGGGGAIRKVTISGIARPYSWVWPATDVPIALTESACGYLRSDRQTKAVIAGRSSSDSTKCVLYDGTTWSLLDGPVGVIGSHLTADAIEVVTRAVVTP